MFTWSVPGQVEIWTAPRANTCRHLPDWPRPSATHRTHSPFRKYVMLSEREAGCGLNKMHPPPHVSTLLFALVLPWGVFPPNLTLNTMRRRKGEGEDSCTVNRKGERRYLNYLVVKVKREYMHKISLSLSPATCIFSWESPSREESKRWNDTANIVSNPSNINAEIDT